MSASRGPLDLRIRPSALVRDVALALVAAEVTLVVCDLAFNYARPEGHGAIRRLFNITREDGLASWFAASQTLLVALTAWAVWGVERARASDRRHGRATTAGRARRAGWLLAATFLTWMAVDDGAKIHERIGTLLGDVAGADSEGLLGRLAAWFPSYGWQLFVMPLFAVAGLALSVFLWRELPRRRARLAVAAAMGLFVLALGLDFIEGLDADHPANLHARLGGHAAVEARTVRWFARHGPDAVEHFSKSIEELCEMLANTLLWVAIAGHLGWLVGELRLRIED